MEHKIKPPDIKDIYNRLKHSAKKRNINFTLTMSELNDISFPISCPVLNIPLKWYRNKPQEDSYSFDRIDSTKGYEIDNLMIISVKANRAKNNLSEEEITKFCNFYKN